MTGFLYLLHYQQATNKTLIVIGRMIFHQKDIYRLTCKIPRKAAQQITINKNNNLMCKFKLLILCFNREHLFAVYFQ